jgi:hypothetical protein
MLYGFMVVVGRLDVDNYLKLVVASDCQRFLEVRGPTYGPCFKDQAFKSFNS